MNLLKSKYCDALMYSIKRTVYIGKCVVSNDENIYWYIDSNSMFIKKCTIKNPHNSNDKYYL